MTLLSKRKAPNRGKLALFEFRLFSRSSHQLPTPNNFWVLSCSDSLYDAITIII